MISALNDVLEFHEAFGHTVALNKLNPKHATPAAMMSARLSWSQSEIDEIVAGFTAGKAAEVADGLVDFRYFNLGHAIAVGVDPTEGAENAAIAMLNEAMAEMVRAFGTWNRRTIEEAIAMAEIVVQGIAGMYGMRLDRVWEAVHEANMAKLGPDGKPLYHPDGKIKKPEGWVAPDITVIVGDGRPEVTDRLTLSWRADYDMYSAVAEILGVPRRNAKLALWFAACEKPVPEGFLEILPTVDGPSVEELQAENEDLRAQVAALTKPVEAPVIEETKKEE